MKRLIGLLLVGVLASPVRAVEQSKIDDSIAKGVAALRKLQSETGAWPEHPGMTALAAVTLLECDVAPTDKAIQKAAEYVREEVISSNATYPISLAIIFLDRLGDPIDIPLIESLTVRLMYGQDDKGGFGYMACPMVPEDEVKRLREQYKTGAKPSRKISPTVHDLAPEVQKQLVALAARGAYSSGAATDHSNSQFATLALWVGRRHGVPVDAVLAALDVRYRTNQNADGGWGYMIPGESKHAMTCAGILGLSVGRGVALSTRKPGSGDPKPLLDPNTDPNLGKALVYLSLAVDAPPSVSRKPIPKIGDEDYYYLWSLERIMVAMDMKLLHGKDWHNWGAEILIANQSPDGKWMGKYGSCGADTCFAVLFLRKANLASDLTAQLRKGTTLSAGGARDKNPTGTKPPPESSKPPNDSTRPPNETKPVDKPKAPPVPTFTASASAREAERLVKATSAEQTAILAELRDRKGVSSTEALAGAIPQLSGEAKRKAREALAERLTRMKSGTLAQYLKDDDVEIRRAAALATGTREFKDHVPQLIELLNDSDPGVVLAAHTALRAMTSQTFGPAPAPWRTWWQQNMKPEEKK
jgi:hypothetical protein